MNMTKLDFDNIRPELLKMRIVPLARSRYMPGFCKSDHKYIFDIGMVNVQLRQFVPSLN